MTERDEHRTDETTAEDVRADEHRGEGSTSYDRVDDDRYDGGVRTDDDGPVDPHEEVEERLQQIEDEQREDREDHEGDSATGAGSAPSPDSAGSPDSPPSPGSAPSADSPDEASDDDAEGAEDPRFESDEDRQAREDAFAAEHDPEQHDVAAGQEFRQAGDWTAEDGKLTEDDVVSEDDGEQGADGRRLSSVEEIRDGGYGVGSAAPIEDGAMPLDHYVKAWEDTKTYLVQGEFGYDGADPDVWFLDDRSAERAGFDHAGG
jgi:hypothetical protein